MEKIEFQGKLWQIVGKARGNLVDNPSSLKQNYGCDMVIRDPRNIYLMLNEVIDVEYEDI